MFSHQIHFEIRHTVDQTPVNPLHFGFGVTDNNPPVIQQLIVYEFDEKDYWQDLTVVVIRPERNEERSPRRVQTKDD